MKRWTRSAAAGFLSAATLFAVCCAVLIPSLRDTASTFGPDGESWRTFVGYVVLPPLLWCGILGAGVAVGIHSLQERRRRGASHDVQDIDSV